MSLIQNLVPIFTRSPADREGGGVRHPELSVKPLHEVKESDEAWGLQVYLPGVAKDGLEFTADEGLRSEERRVGKECRSRWSPYH